MDSSNFLASKTVAAALVEVEPGAMRELHWHPNNDEWQLLPYNLGFGGTNMTKNKKPRFSIIANDRLNPRDYQRFTFQWLREAYRALKAGSHLRIY
ncbi:hypothetical protein ABD74_19570 [Brevibacillus laterosporus]|nr:hypothetical protein [Brevibacillus laterosporus]